MRNKKLHHGMKALITIININKEISDKQRLLLCYPIYRWSIPYENQNCNWPPVFNAHNIMMLLDVMQTDEYKAKLLKKIKFVINRNENELFDIRDYISNMNEPYRSEALAIVDN